MKASMWRKIARDFLLPYLPGWQLQGDILVFDTVDWIVRGLVQESSPYGAVPIAVWMFSQPLYVPSDEVRFTYGDRLREPKTQNEWWDLASSESTVLHMLVDGITKNALPLYARTASPQALAAYSESQYRRSKNPPVIEVEAYSWALAGEGRKATHALERLKDAVEAMPPDKPWGQPILERSLLVRQALNEGPQSVMHLLGAWRNETMRHLKLETPSAFPFNHEESIDT